MQKLYSLLFFFLCAAISYGQTGEPSNLPNPNAPSNYYRIGFMAANKGFIYQERDTFCAKYPTVVKHLDHRFYYTNGNCTRWYGFGGDEIISFTKNTSRDSVILLLRDGRRLAVKDSVGNIIINGDTTLITNILTTIINGDTTLITNIIHGDTTFFTTIINQIIDSLGPDTIRLQFPLYAITPDSIAWRRDSLPKMDYGLPGRDTTLWGNYTIVDKKFVNDKFVTSVVKHAGTDSFFYWRNGVETFIGTGGSGGNDSAYIDVTLINDSSIQFRRINGGLDTVVYRSCPDGGGGGAASGWLLTGNTVTAGVDFLGTLNNTSLRLRTNNIQRMMVDSTGRVGINTNSPAATLDLSQTSLTTADSSRGVYLRNTTAAISGTQQYSPALTFEGQGYTPTVPASESVKWQMFLKPVQHSSTPSSELVFRANEDNGTWLDCFTLGKASGANTSAVFAGSLDAASISSTTFVHAQSVTATQGLFINNWAFMRDTSQDSYGAFSTNAASAGAYASVWSPRTHWRGAAWSGAASQTADFGVEVKPISGTNPITADLVFTSGINQNITATINMTTDILKISDRGKLTLLATNTAGGTTGAQTINNPTGSVNFAIGATSLVLTNSLITTASLVFCQVMTHDATATSTQIVVGSGTATIWLNAAATAETKVAFWVIN